MNTNAHQFESLKHLIGYEGRYLASDYPELVGKRVRIVALLRGWARMHEDAAENYPVFTNPELARVGGATKRDGVAVYALDRVGRPGRTQYEILWGDVEGLDWLWSRAAAKEVL